MDFRVVNPLPLTHYCKKKKEKEKKSTKKMIEVEEMQQTGKPQVVYGTSSATSETGDPDARMRSTAGQPLTSSVAGLHTRAGESSAPPQFLPHFSDETVDLVLSEEDRVVVLGEVQRLEVYSFVV